MYFLNRVEVIQGGVGEYEVETARTEWQGTYVSGKKMETLFTVPLPRAVHRAEGRIETEHRLTNDILDVNQHVVRTERFFKQIGL